MSLSFVVEEAGCESCAKLVREALEPLGTVESIEIDEAADVAAVRLDTTGATESDVDRALAAVSVGAGHAYRVRPGSWDAS
jgi:copper chaperone CopZ